MNFETALTPAFSRPTGEGAPATAWAGEGGFLARVTSA